ncbi:Colicin V production protein [bacterium HR25]|jgi:membrane protein required for colicin V production|nr:Colicin V production protein [bacterium HR25]
MNWLDAVIILILAWFTINAFRAGLVREVVTLAGIVLALGIAGFYYDNLAQDVLLFINNDISARVVAFLLLFASVFLISQLVAFLLRGLVAILMLGWADHLAGTVLGFLKGLIIVEALLILFVTYPRLGLEDAIRGSALAPIFLDFAPVLLRLLPGEFRDAVNAF